MTIHLPNYRNSFNWAWLLLLLPPLASLAVIWWNDNPPELVGQGLRLIVTLVVIVPLLWLRADHVSGRTQRLLKELRTLMPGCLIAVLLPGFLALLGERDTVEWETAAWGVSLFGFGCLLMGASSFGSEFEQRTMAGLLAQPLSRGTLFLEKLGALGLLLLFATINLLIARALGPVSQNGFENTAQVLAIPLFVFCSGPLFGLLSRSTLAALIFTLTVPFILVPVVLLPLQGVYRLGHPGEFMPDAWFTWMLNLGAPIYLLGMCGLGWRVFRRLEVRDGGAGGRSATGLHPLSWPVDAVLRRFGPVAGGTVQLIRKELRLHVVPWLVASLMTGLWLLWLLVRGFTHDEELLSTLNQVSALTVFAGLLGSLVVVGAGAACVAEERELGTLEWQLTQPVSVRRQWWVKVAVTLVLGIVFGVLLPAVLLWLGFSRDKIDGTFGDIPVVGWCAGGGLFLLVSAVSIYASSISRNTMKAVATAAGVAAGFAGVVLLAAWTMGTAMDERLSLERQNPADAVMPAWAPSQELVSGVCIALVSIAVVLFFAALLWTAGRNCRQMVVSARTVSRQLAVITAGLLIVLGVSGAAVAKLVLLYNQAGRVETQRLKRADVVGEVRTLARSGKLAPAIYEQFGVPTNATPDALLDAVVAKEGPRAFYQIERILVPPTSAAIRAHILDYIRGMTEEGLVKPAAYARLGIPTNATPEVILEAVIAKEGPKSTLQIMRLLDPGPSAAAADAAMDIYRLDPLMARRYGLLRPDPLSTNVYVPQADKMDPALARYGLIPKAPPTDTAPLPK